MKKLFLVTAIVALAACDFTPQPDPLAHLPAQARADIRQADNKPIKISEVEGVKLWKVKDSTPGGSSWVYFTSRGDTFEQHKRGKATVHQGVPGVPE